jgi:hypothetical protein
MAFFQQQDNIYKREMNINDEDLTSTFYTLSGQEDEIIDDKPIKSTESEEVYAKVLQKKDGSYKHMIRTSADGKLYNPVSIYGQEKTNGFLDRICRSNDKFKKVNEKAFNWYVQFLSTKNLSWFHNAEREIE